VIIYIAPIQGKRKANVEHEIDMLQMIVLSTANLLDISCDNQTSHFVQRYI